MTQTLLPPDLWDPLVPPPGHLKRRRRHPVRQRVLRIVAGGLVVFILLAGVSYARALTYPGSASWQSRTTGWLRNNGGGFAVNAAENWYYTRNQPASTAPNPASLPQLRASTTPSSVATLPVLPLLPGTAPLPGEGRWVPGRTAATGQPALYTSYFQPDPAHASIVAGVAFLPAGSTQAHLVAGSTQPGRSFPTTARIPPSAAAAVAATFNSGFKLRDITGGFYLNGRIGKALQNGAASLVIDKAGQLTVGQWGRDITMSPQITAVRQNLALIVDSGHPVDGLNVNADQRWGSAKNQLQYTWRSGIGIDNAGNTIYVAGDKLNLAMLASTMTQAGVVRGMQLDIHPGLAYFASWLPAGHIHAGPTKLLPAMPSHLTQLSSAYQRDFFYLTVGSAPTQVGPPTGVQRLISQPQAR